MEREASVLSGDELRENPFTEMQLARLGEAIRQAETSTNVAFEVFVGRLEHGRGSALEVHSDMTESEEGVLIAVDPHNRGLEIVTGSVAKQSISDRACQLAALAMTSRFAIGDLANGIRDGIGVLSDHAKTPIYLHRDLPENA